MSRWNWTRGGRRSQDIARIAGLLLLAPLVTPPRPGTGHVAARPAEETSGSDAAAEIRPATLTPPPGPAHRREAALRGAPLRPHGPRVVAPRHPAGAPAPDLALGSGFAFDLDGCARTLAATARPGTTEGVSHADGIRGPPCRVPAAPREQDPD